MKKFLKSTVFALQGLKQFFLKERNGQIQIIISVIAILIAFWLNISVTEWLFILIFISLGISLEMLNSAIEKLCNMVNPDFHPLIKNIKDLAAGAVLVASVFSLIAGLIIFIPKIFHLLSVVK